MASRGMTCRGLWHPGVSTPMAFCVKQGLSCWFKKKVKETSDDIRYWITIPAIRSTSPETTNKPGSCNGIDPAKARSGLVFPSALHALSEWHPAKGRLDGTISLGRSPRKLAMLGLGNRSPQRISFGWSHRLWHTHHAVSTLMFFQQTNLLQSITVKLSSWNQQSTPVDHIRSVCEHWSWEVGLLPVASRLFNVDYPSMIPRVGKTWSNIIQMDHIMLDAVGHCSGMSSSTTHKLALTSAYFPSVMVRSQSSGRYQLFSLLAPSNASPKKL